MASIELEIVCDGCNAPLGATLSLGKVYVIECGACRDKAVAEAREEGIEEGRHADA